MTEEIDSAKDITPLSPQLEKDLEIVRRIVSVAMGVLLILVAGFVYNIITGDGLTFVKPSPVMIL